MSGLFPKPGELFPKLAEPFLRNSQHWGKKKKALDEKMKSVSSEYLDGFREDIVLYADIRKYLPRLTDIMEI